jgi:GT2 family glycosyltransferase
MCSTGSRGPERAEPVRVSVLLTTCNGADFLAGTLASVLAQRGDDFEVVAVDDCSTDGTAALLAACGDPRLRVLRSPRRLGVAEARNFGFAACRGAYIAAQDHDDLSRPERLAVEAAYLDEHPDIVLVGSEVLISEHGKLRPTDHRPGSTPALMRWMLWLDNPFTWSSVMFRAAAVRRLGRFMRAEYEPADDYDLLLRLQAVGGLARLDETLAVYRWHRTNTSYGQMDRMYDRAAALRTELYREGLGEEAAAAAALVVRHLVDRQPVADAAGLAGLGSVLERLQAAFCAATRPDPALRAAIAAHTALVWWRTARAAVRSGSPASLRCWREAVGLRAGFRPAAYDVAVSLAVGTVRGALRRSASAATRCKGAGAGF